MNATAHKPDTQNELPRCSYSGENVTVGVEVCLARFYLSQLRHIELALSKSTR